MVCYIIDMWGDKKGKFVRQLLQRVEAFCFLIYGKKKSFFSYLPRQKLFKAFLENRWPSPLTIKREEKRDQEKFAYISEVSFQLWESQGIL